MIFPDVNECEVRNGGCEQICDNTQGSFRCNCQTGFRLSNDKSSCIGKLQSIRINMTKLSLK